MGRLRFCLLGLLVAFAMSGCAIHQPMSQTLLFRDAGATSPTHSSSHGVGFSGTSSLGPTGYLRNEAERRFGTGASVTPKNLENRSLGLYGSYYADQRLGLSVSLGRAVGLDGTLKIWRRNYLTAGISYGGAQAFLHHRTLNTPHVGAAFGIGYRYDRKVFNVDEYVGAGEGNSFFGDDTYKAIPLPSVGGRALVVLRPWSDIPGVVLGTLYVGYSPTFRRPVMTVGVTTGIF